MTRTPAVFNEWIKLDHGFSRYVSDAEEDPRFDQERFRNFNPQSSSERPDFTVAYKLLSGFDNPSTFHDRRAKSHRDSVRTMSLSTEALKWLNADLIVAEEQNALLRAFLICRSLNKSAN